MRDEDEQIARRLGAVLREQRQTRGWSQALLAEKLDVSVDYVGLLERGERLPAVGMLVHIASTLGVSVDALLGARPRDSWSDEALALLASVPEPARPIVLAMLRGAAALKPATPRPRRSRPR